MMPPRLSIRHLMLALASIAVVLGVVRQGMVLVERERLAASAKRDRIRHAVIRMGRKEFSPLLVDPAR